MNIFNKAKLAKQMLQVKKQLAKELMEIEGGEGAVVIEITGEQKIKKVHIDPDRIDLDNIEELEEWLVEAMREAIKKSQEVAAEKMKPFMSQIGNMGL